MLDNVVNYIFRLGLSKDEFEQAQPDINKGNRTNILVFCRIGIPFFLIALFLSFFDGVIPFINAPLYGGGAGLLIFLFLVNKFDEKGTTWVISLSSYLLIIGVIGFGIAMAVSPASVDERSTFILGCYMIAAAFFCLVPAVYAVVITLCELVFIFVIAQYQTDMLFLVNSVNSAVFAALSILVAIYLMCVKAARYNSERTTRYLLEVDQLTGIYNRRSYELALDFLSGDAQNCTVAAFDVNGLKIINDTLGHKAGDELIKGAAECINSVFAPYGKCFRTGGDEFMAILSKPIESTELLKKEFEQTVANWHGNLVPNLNIACGLVRAADYQFDSVDELTSKADEKMYAAKALYYSETGHDRRRK